MKKNTDEEKELKDSNSNIEDNNKDKNKDKDKGKDKEKEKAGVVVEGIKKYFKKMKEEFPKIYIFTLILISGIVIHSVFVALDNELDFFKRQPQEMSYQEFKKNVDNKKVKEVTLDYNSPNFVFTDIDEKSHIVSNPRTSTFKEVLLNNNIKVNEVEVKDNKYSALISKMLSTLLYLFIFYKIVGEQLNFSSSLKNMENTSQIPDTGFKDIAGNEEAKEEMKYLVEFLKNPKAYNELGAVLPKGVVFYGEPGTGKTLMAKAIAGEADVPLFAISGSDFVEMYAGLGAKKVRKLFETAKENAPCIIFIDEIDAIGGSRDNQENDSEKNQTINALLAELDGFNSKEGILVICATNRVESLDKALIRSGRFDKHIGIRLPEREDRLKILDLYSKNKNIAEDVDFEEIAKLTYGYSGADLFTLLNEATINAVNDKRGVVSREDIDDAYFRQIIKGFKRSTKDRTIEEKTLIAWHEAGHALVAKKLTNNTVPKVTIIPSTNGTGGATFNIPKETGLLSREELENDIKVLYAGRIAEYLLLESETKVTTGASNDISVASEKLYHIINSYGMNCEIGMVNVKHISDNDDLVMKNVYKLSKKLYAEALDFLMDNKELLKAIADELIAKETIDENDLDEIISTGDKKYVA